MIIRVLQSKYPRRGFRIGAYHDYNLGSHERLIAAIVEASQCVSDAPILPAAEMIRVCAPEIPRRKPAKQPAAKTN